MSDQSNVAMKQHDGMYMLGCPYCGYIERDEWAEHMEREHEISRKPW